MLSLPILIAFLTSLTANGLPHILIDAGTARCVELEAARDSIVRIMYEAPEVVADENNPDFAPAFLGITMTPNNRVLDPKLHESPIQERLRPLTKEIRERSGNVTHKFPIDGTAKVCIRAPNPKHRDGSPLLFGFKIDWATASEHASASKTNVTSHLTHMQEEMQRIEILLRHVLSEADFAQERDALFHKQFQSMNSATMFWPIVQVCVLLMTGFTQATHIVKFFQSRRII